MTTDRTTHVPADDTPDLERYLDGLLEGAALTAFQQRLAGDTALRTQIDAHHALRQRLTLLYASLPDSPQPSTSNATEVRGSARTSMTHSSTAHTPRPSTPTRFNPRRVALAAGILIPLAAAAWLLWPQPAAPVFTPLTAAEKQASHRDAIFAEYRRQIAKGFKPAEVCTTDDEFEAWTERSIGVPLRPTLGSPGTPKPVYAGWSRATIFSSYTGLLLATIDGKPVMVVIDAAPPDRFVPGESRDNNLRLFSRKVGGANGAWLVEVTPLDQPRVLTVIEAVRSEGEPVTR